MLIKLYNTYLPHCLKMLFISANSSIIQEKNGMSSFDRNFCVKDCKKVAPLIGCWYKVCVKACGILLTCNRVVVLA